MIDEETKAAIERLEACEYPGNAPHELGKWEAESRMRDLWTAFRGLVAERDKLAAFKEYVHARLDAAGVTTDPESAHKAEGCRIGGRLDVLIGERDALESNFAAWRDRTSDEAHRLREIIADLKAALEPFALLGSDNPQAAPGVPVRFWSNEWSGGEAVPPTMADCFRAAELLTEANQT